MLLLTLAAATQLSAPQGTDIRTVFSDEDAPMEWLPAESDRSVGVRLTVRPDGKVQSCEIEYPSGLDRLDIYTCKIVKRRSKFAPASAQSGTPAFAVLRTTVRWIVTGFASGPARRASADLTLAVQSLPPGIESPEYVAVSFEVDENGRASSCSAETPPRGHDAEDPQLVRVACEQLLKTYRPIPAKDERGKQVASVQNALVAFTTK